MKKIKRTNSNYKLFSQRNDGEHAVCHFSLCRRVRGFLEPKACEENRRLQTPAPWEREEPNQATRRPLLQEEASACRKRMHSFTELEP